MGLIQLSISGPARVFRPGSSEAGAVANQSAQRNITNSQVRASSQSQLIMPTGSVIPYAGTNAPDGFLLCDGREYPIADYPNLYDVLQFNFGGSGVYFQVPDLRGRVVVAPDRNIRRIAASRITTNNEFAQSGGAETHTLTTAQLPSHNHGISATQAVNTTATGGANRLTTLNNALGGGNQANSANTGSGNAHNNLQPYLVLNYIIRY